MAPSVGAIVEYVQSGGVEGELGSAAMGPTGNATAVQVESIVEGGAQ
jgi:hypothetical protein